MSYIYPTFSRDIADEVFEELERKVLTDRPVSPFPTGGHHPRATYSALGGSSIVPVAVLEDLHDSIRDALKTNTSRSKDERHRHFDATVGKVLVDHFQEHGITQAANPDTWSYLALIALPDIAIERYPATKSGLTKNRFIADRRNVFYSRYLRSMTLGELLHDPDLPIFEEELVGLFDRHFSNNQELAQKVSNKIATVPRGTSRRIRIRRGLKEINFELRVTDLSGLPNNELDDVLDDIFAD